MASVKVLSQRESDYSRESDERYSYWSERNFTNFDCLTSPNTNPTYYGHNNYELIPVNFKPKNMETYYLVYVIYDSGDSFGLSTDKVIILSVYDNANDAFELASLIDKAALENAKKRNFYSIEFKGETFHNDAWTGYFENYKKCKVINLTYKEKL